MESPRGESELNWEPISEEKKAAALWLYERPHITQKDSVRHAHGKFSSWIWNLDRKIHEQEHGEEERIHLPCCFH